MCYYEAEVPYDDHHMLARFVTSFMTQKGDVDLLLEKLLEFKDRGSINGK